MPHLITNRKRRHGFSEDQFLGLSNFSWESFNAIAYIAGGSIFVIGSVFFIPAYKAHYNTGIWLFIIGSFLYLVVTVHDLAESVGYWRQQAHSRKNLLEILASVIYVAGTLLFVIGSGFFSSTIDMVPAGAWCFITGSVLFLIGAVINVMQIVTAGAMLTLQLLNATAICFALGSLLFAVASVPYFWNIKNPLDEQRLFTYLGCEYVLGSLLFLMGGAINFYRALIAERYYRDVGQHSRNSVLH